VDKYLKAVAQDQEEMMEGLSSDEDASGMVEDVHVEEDNQMIHPVL
jgi:hypothetical protein